MFWIGDFVMFELQHKVGLSFEWLEVPNRIFLRHDCHYSDVELRTVSHGTIWCAFLVIKGRDR